MNKKYFSNDEYEIAQKTWYLMWTGCAANNTTFEFMQKKKHH